LHNITAKYKVLSESVRKLKT